MMRLGIRSSRGLFELRVEGSQRKSYQGFKRVYMRPYHEGTKTLGLKRDCRESSALWSNTLIENLNT